MCGIAGILGRPDEAVLRSMLEAQRHRGPDGLRIWMAPGEMALGHARLSIIDVEGGTQPLSNEDGTLHAIVNGEIYNYKALRQELEGRHTFRTGSDSEVVLHLFEEYGESFVKKLDGMFAIALWGRDSGLYLARDPLGIKPLYWGYDDEGNLCFASEIGPLLEQVAELQELPNGSYWRPGQGRQPVHYYTVPRPVHGMKEPLEAIDLLEQTMLKAVRKRLMADVPLGVFLSGGLDSSLISAMTRRMVRGPLHSFAVGLEGSADLRNARQVAEDIGTTHHERVLTPGEIIAALPKVVAHLESCDPALVRSAIPTYFVSEMAARYVKVVLSGEGADELFAGYHYLNEFEPDPVALSDELHLITANLHNSNLQRVDRMTMLHGLEGRVPFLDKSMVELAFQMDPCLKRREGESKWVLRKVAERYLRASIVWREKEKFAIGTGIGPLLQRYAEETVSDGDVPEGRSKEEWLYWTLFRERFDRPDVLATMGRSRSLNPGQRWVAGV